MKTLAVLAVAAVMSLPSLAVACDFHEEHAQMSCAEGLVYDASSRSCVQPTG